MRVLRLGAAMGVESSATDRQIDLIYAALLGEATWRAFLDDLSGTLPDGKATLFYHDITQGGGAWELHSGIPPEALREYASHYSRINPWMKSASTRTVGLGVIAEQMVSQDSFRATEFYNDFFRKQMGETAVGVTIARDRGLSFLLSIATSRSDPHDNLEAAERLTLLAPHLRRAFKHMRSGASQRVLESVAGCLFDAIEIGFVLVGEDGRAKSLSEAGGRTMSHDHPVQISATGKAVIRDEGANAALSAMIRRSYSGPKSMTFALGDVRLTIVQVNKDDVSSFFEGPTAVLLIEFHGKGRNVPTSADISRRFGLTTAEVRALEGIRLGNTLADIADQAGLSRETVKTQFKSLFAKTGVGSQIELIRRFGSLPRLEG